MNKKIELLFIFCISLILSGCSIFKSGQSTYQNPVFEPVLADPSIIRAEDGYFYVFGTEDDWGDGQGPRLIPIIRSRNLVNWEYVGEVFETKPSWKTEGGLWAPDISFFNNRYYLYYAWSVWGDPNPAIGVAIANAPAGPFEDQGKLFDSKEIGVQNSIDPHLFVDHDGTPYLFWGSWHGIWGVELSDDGLTYVGEPFQIAGTSFEAPYLIRRNNYYYLFVSLGSCCEGQWSTYRVAVARSDSLKGPYLDRDGNNIMGKNEGTLILAEGNKFAGPGHIAIITDDAGTDWIVYHAIDKDEPFLGNGATRRPLMIDPIIWEDDWPIIKNMIPSKDPQKAPVIR